MEVRKGYKQTEVGVIPRDWDVKKLGSISSLIASGKSDTKPSDGIYPIYGSTGIIGLSNKYDYEGEKILVARVGANAGTVNWVNGKYCVSDNTLMVQLKNDIYFLYAVFFLRLFNINKLVFGSGQPLITGSQLKQLPIPLPPTKAEQTAIAAVLSDADALISNLEKLIAKKRNIKQGIMQQLLTGKKRLLGFGNLKGKPNSYKMTEIGVIPEDWDMAKVNDITINHRQGYYTKDKYVNEGTALVRITDLFNPRINYFGMPKLNVSKNDFELYKIKKGDFLFARSGAIGRYGIVYEDVNAVFGSYIIRFTFDIAKVINEYFGFLYETELVLKQLLSITQGSSNININANNIKSIKIPLPTLLEQTAIAQVLSDMDAEIEALEKKLEKYKMIKQGMMQELLTGKTRLV